MSAEALAYLSAALAAGAIVVALIQWGTDLRFWWLAKRVTDQQEDSEYIASFSDNVLRDALKTYVIQDCGQLDPSHESDLRRVADLRKPSFKVLERFLTGSTFEKHLLVLADSGMGKTSLCVNYYAHLVGKKQPVCMFSLSRRDAIKDIAAVRSKRNTVCIVDALDEDFLAIKDMNKRLFEIYQATANFKAIIITCRSQFFKDQASIPSDTRIFLVGPRRGGVGLTHKILHVYLLPFDEGQIELFIKRQFRRLNPVNFSRRKAANALIQRIPELSVRPMLLDLLPDLVREKTDAQELYDLYTYLVEKWFSREDHWISAEVLEQVSIQLAVTIHAQAISGNGDRINSNQLEDVAKELGVPAEHWENLTTRSLLNRD